MSIPLRQVRELKDSLQKAPPLLTTESLLVFTCGGEKNPEKPCARDLVLEYVSKHLKGYHFFEAEAFFNAFESKDKPDLLTLEERLADYSDCILILLESPGTLAELGAFTMVDKLAKIVLAVNDKQHITTRSFISLGPIAKLNQISKFRPIIYADFNSILTSLPEITERLTKLKRQRSQRVDISTYVNLCSEPKIKLLYLLDLISLFSPLQHHELIIILKIIYGHNDYDINAEIALLMTLKLIKREDKYILSTVQNNEIFFDFAGISFARFRSRVMAHYSKQSRHRLVTLNSRIAA